MRSVSIDEFLTDKEIKACMRLVNAKAIHDEVIAPNLDRIEASLGQECDAMYLSYVCEWAVRSTMKGANK